MKNETADNTKLKVIIEIVKRKQVDFGFAPLNDANAQMQAESWIDHLENIPTNRLRDCYKDAMRGRDPKNLFSPTDMFQAWQRLKQREAENREDPCGLCKDTGIVECFDLDTQKTIRKGCPAH